MPIQVELIRNDSVVLQTYSEPLDSTQMKALSIKMESSILPSAAGKVHIIADFRAVKNLPNTILSSGTSMLRTPHPNAGHIICVTPNAFITAMARIFSKLSTNHQFTIVQTIEEAYHAIDTLQPNTN